MPKQTKQALNSSSAREDSSAQLLPETTTRLLLDQTWTGMEKDFKTPTAAPVWEANSKHEIKQFKDSKAKAQSWDGKDNFLIIIQKLWILNQQFISFSSYIFQARLLQCLIQGKYAKKASKTIQVKIME